MKTCDGHSRRSYGRPSDTRTGPPGRTASKLSSYWSPQRQTGTAGENTRRKDAGGGAPTQMEGYFRVRQGGRADVSLWWGRVEETEDLPRPGLRTFISFILAIISIQGENSQIGADESLLVARLPSPTPPGGRIMVCTTPAGTGTAVTLISPVHLGSTRPLECGPDRCHGHNASARRVGGRRRRHSCTQTHEYSL